MLRSLGGKHKTKVQYINFTLAAQEFLSRSILQQTVSAGGAHNSSLPFPTVGKVERFFNPLLIFKPHIKV
ncbi:MAG TPA: hypothetical protein VJN64_12635 [Terriglobales bacterium]|nr:hypothetical protein [Terriglobales bacterium]